MTEHPLEWDTWDCPYFFCSAVVHLVPVANPDATTGVMIKGHEIEHPKLKGSCVASLMYLPITDAVRQIFREREASDRRTLAVLGVAVKESTSETQPRGPEWLIRLGKEDEASE